MDISFLLNGSPVTLHDIGPTETLLDWLRETRGLTATKEGCREGDCGACTVIVTDRRRSRALNACILLLPQLHGLALRTVEGISGPDGTLHPVQQEMIDHHGAQCGFCTPGFIAAMACAHLNGDTDHDRTLAGNLCRCTGYAPILRAARAAGAAPVPEWMHADRTALNDPAFTVPEILPGGPEGRGAEGPPRALHPRNAQELARICAAHPEATLVAGATDLALRVTKELRDIELPVFLARCSDLKQIAVTDTEIRLGAGVTIDRLMDAIAPHHPAYAAMLRRYGSEQVRAVATLGGNIANGSPIGDNAPALIALGATLHLRGGASSRAVPLEDFFLDYGRQDRAADEFIAAVSLPRQPDRLRCHKISKRFDQDISALLGCFNITVENGRVTAARIAFGGMAGIPKRAARVEAALIGRPWTETTLTAIHDAWEQDFTPLSDMRVSAGYRLGTARNLLLRCLLEDRGMPVCVREMQP